MIEKVDIIKMAKHVLRRDRGVPDRKIMHPVRDWLIGILGASTLFVFVMAYTGYTFFSGINEGSVAPDANSKVIRYDQETVIETLEFYKGKAAQFEMLRNDISNRTVVPEESLPVEEVEEQSEQEDFGMPTSE
jgi:hypothetical protein